MNAAVEGPEGACHHHQAVYFLVDGERLEIRTDRLKVREILDLVDADPAHHYIVELGDCENIPYTNLDQEIQIRDGVEFITVYTGETPLS